MRVKITWRPSRATAAQDYRRMKILTDLPENARIEDLLERFYAKSLAEWSESEGCVIGTYRYNGPLENDKCYHVCSGNIRRTMRVITERYAAGW